MKIVFLCGSLEPGRDGVGDYTRRLAAELLRQKHQVGIISLNDRQLVEQVSETAQQDEEQFIKTLRLSNRLPWVERVRRASAFVETLNPDWISLQYVPFAFQDKGLPFNLTPIIKQLCRNRSLHIMFHELWVGMSIQSSKRHVWWGIAQRYLIQSLLKSLRPEVVHTHTPLYQVQLVKLGIQASILPLFTNIPLTSNRSAHSSQTTSEAENRIAFVVFGGIHPGAPLDQFVNEINIYAQKRKATVDLTIIGRSGPEQENWASAWRSHNLVVNMLGEQSIETISDVLRQSTIGLSTTPIALAGKSGSIAAMHTHGLPVLCVSPPWQSRIPVVLKPSSGILEYSFGNFEQVISNRKGVPLPLVNVSNIAQQFINSF